MLLENQSTEEIDTVSSASHSGENFRKLVEAVIEQAVKGNSETIIVE